MYYGLFLLASVCRGSSSCGVSSLLCLLFRVLFCLLVCSFACLVVRLLAHPSPCVCFTAVLFSKWRQTPKLTIIASVV